MMILNDIFYYINEYALTAFFIAFATGILSYVVNGRKNQEKFNKSDYAKHIIMLMLSMGYAYMVVAITFLSRESDTIRYINLKLFSSVYANRTIIKYMVENILLFIPYGIIYGIEHGEYRSFNISFIMKRAVLTSIVIELCQYITARGRTEIDDIVTNTIGAIIGWECIRLIAYIVKRKNEYKVKC